MFASNSDSGCVEKGVGIPGQRPDEQVGVGRDGEHAAARIDAQGIGENQRQRGKREKDSPERPRHGQIVGSQKSGVNSQSPIRFDDCNSDY